MPVIAHVKFHFKTLFHYCNISISVISLWNTIVPNSIVIRTQANFIVIQMTFNRIINTIFQVN